MKSLKLKQSWDKLKSREKMLLLIAGLALVVFFADFLVWTPQFNKLKVNSANLTTANKDLLEISKQLAEISKKVANTKESSGPAQIDGLNKKLKEVDKLLANKGTLISGAQINEYNQELVSVLGSKIIEVAVDKPVEPKEVAQGIWQHRIVIKTVDWDSLMNTVGFIEKKIGPQSLLNIQGKKESKSDFSLEYFVLSDEKRWSL